MAGSRRTTIPNSVSMEWEAPWRTARIYHVLESGRQFSAADMLSLQTDIQSEAELFAAERLEVRRRSCSQAVGAREAGGGLDAKLGWTDDGLVGGADDRREFDHRAAALALGTEAG